MGVSEVIILKKSIRIKKDLISDNQIMNVYDIRELIECCDYISDWSKQLLKEWGNRTR